MRFKLLIKFDEIASSASIQTKWVPPYSLPSCNNFLLILNSGHPEKTFSLFLKTTAPHASAIFFESSVELSSIHSILSENAFTELIEVGSKNSSFLKGIKVIIFMISSFLKTSLIDKNRCCALLLLNCYNFTK